MNEVERQRRLGIKIGPDAVLCAGAAAAAELEEAAW
jgi:preprotein translocase subunit Sec61beta